MKRPTFGTGIRREPDIASIARSLRSEGIDPRTWVSYGTVGTFDGDNGEPDFTDPNAILVGPQGVDVDVILSPTGEPVTCRYAGIQGGRTVTLFAPIHPGDEVIVGIAGGVHGNIPVILAVLNSAHTLLPLEQDGKPVFKNDRLSVFAKDVPIEIRTAGGARAVLAQDGSINLNQGDKGVARLDDTTKLTMSAADIARLATQLLATSVFIPSGNPPTVASPVTFNDGKITSASGSVKAGG